MLRPGGSAVGVTRLRKILYFSPDSVLVEIRLDFYQRNHIGKCALKGPCKFQATIGLSLTSDTVTTPDAFGRHLKDQGRISLLTGLRPPFGLACDSHFQYNRNPARCQPTTVRGVTRMSGCFHPAQCFPHHTAHVSPCHRGLGRTVTVWKTL